MCMRLFETIVQKYLIIILQGLVKLTSYKVISCVKTNQICCLSRGPRLWNRILNQQQKNVAYF